MTAAPAHVLRAAEWDGLPAVSEVIDPGGRRVLTEIGYDLAIRDVGSTRTRPLTSGGTADRPWRVNAQVYSLLPDAAVWSPDGRLVVTVQADYAEVPRHPFVDWLADPPAVDIRPQPVESSPHHGRGRPAVIDTTTGDLRWIALPEDVLWTPLRWEIDSSAVFLLGVQFSGVVLLARADAATGRSIVLVTEAVTGVFPYLPGLVSAVRAPTEPGACWWLSDRDGDRRLYHVTQEGAVPMTPAGVQVDGVVGNDQEPGLLVLARPFPSKPYDVHLCRCDLGRLVPIAPTRDPSNDVEDDGEPFVVLAADGVTRLHGALFRPVGFDPRRQYPVVHCIYGGPQTIAHQTVATHLWGSCRALATALAELGFVTTVVDARGTPGRGRAFQWPDVVDRVAAVVEDHRAALLQLASDRPWMDLERCGVVGTSFGGYFAAECGLRYPALFRAVVAHAGAYEPRAVLPGWFPGLLQASYDVDPAAYHDASVITHAKEFEAALLLIHGTADANVTLDQTMRLSAALTAAGRHHELLLLPGQRHHLDDGAGKFALEAAARFFMQVLSR